MLQGATLPLAAKICAAVVVTGGAGVATYQVADLGEKEPTTVVAAEQTDVPESLALEDDVVETTPALLVTEEASSDKIEEEESDDHEATEVADTEAPEIVILSPEADSHHDDKVLVFKGETEPGAKVSAGPYEATVDADGHWKIELVLSEGPNTATITATDAAGNVGTATVTVWLDVKEKETDDKTENDKDHESDGKHDDKDEEVANVAFTAKQQYGFCDAAEPYDVFWGTAKPNSHVTISSPYGSATVEVNKHGDWEKKVYFEGAPIGQPFTVTVTGENGSATFQFTAKSPPAEHDEKDESKHEDGHGDDGKE